MRRAMTAAVSACMVAGVFAPVAQAAPAHVGLTIQLLDGPASLEKDPRAHAYVIDHVVPGATFVRHVAVYNDTGAAQHILIYPDAAAIDRGSFIPAPGHSSSELTDWITVTPSSVDLQQGQRVTASVAFNVPKDASRGERYGVVFAELPAKPTEGVSLASRVGVRVYLDVGSGGAPPSDFAITTLTGARDPDGFPLVTASVKNTGGRALDMSGQLWLKNGPGGLSAGPFPAQLGTTLGIGQEEPVTVKLDKRLPAGPWLAHLELQSDLIKHAAEATITFPTQAGTVGKTVKAKAVPLTKNKQVLGIVAGSIIGLVLVGILIFLFLLWKRRGDDEDDDKRRSGPPNIPQSRAKESLRDRVRR